MWIWEAINIWLYLLVFELCSMKKTFLGILFPFRLLSEIFTKAFIASSRRLSFNFSHLSIESRSFWVCFNFYCKLFVFILFVSHIEFYLCSLEIFFSFIIPQNITCEFTCGIERTSMYWEEQGWSMKHSCYNNHHSKNT